MRSHVSDVSLYTRVGRVAGRENYTWAGSLSVYRYHAAHVHVHVRFAHQYEARHPLGLEMLLEINLLSSCRKN